MTSVLVLLSLCPSLVAAPADEMADGLLRQAGAALRRGEAGQALKFLTAALERDAKNARAYFLRGHAHDLLGRHKDAVADFSRVLELDPAEAQALDRRGDAHFKLGDFERAAKDFDRYLKARPAEARGHWRRGIALYYAGRYEDGQKQFEGYEQVDTNDVENAVWHLLCLARRAGLDKARAAVLKIGRDRRVPMMVVYDLFRGTAKPDDVLKAAAEGKPEGEERTRRLFYAHLYLGLYHDLLGEEKEALRHLDEATEKHRVGHYMWDVARVHRDRLKRKPEK
jgi:lipoprotein NlpI